MSEALRHLRFTILGLATGPRIYRLALGADWGFQIGGLLRAAPLLLHFQRRIDFVPSFSLDGLPRKSGVPSLGKPL
jgi:hypothetical protein